MVAAQAVYRDTRAGQILFRVNEPGTTFCVVLLGTFRVLVPGPRGDEVLNQLGPGEWFGEMALLTGEPRAATIVAATDGLLAELDAVGFQALMSQLPGFAAALSHTLSHRLRARVLVRPRPPCPQVIAVLSALPSFEEAKLVVNLAAALADVGSGSTAVLDHVALPRLGSAPPDSAVAVFDGASTDGAAVRAQHTFVLLRLSLSTRSAAELVQAADAVWAFDDKDKQALQFLRALRNVPPLTFLRGLDISPATDDGPTSGDVSVIRKAPIVLLDRHDPGAVTLRRFARRVLGRRVGLALSAGGAKGLAHLGVLRCFERGGLEIDLIAGTSMGGVIGGFVAMGRSSADMIDVFTALRDDFRRRLLDFSIPGTSLLRGAKKRRVIREHTGDTRIEDLAMPFRSVAGDLVSGREVVLGSGPLWQALDATSAIPAVFPPVIVGGQALVDGWVVNPLPTDVLRREGADIVIAVDASGGTQAATDFDETVSARLSIATRLWRRFSNPAIVRVVMRAMEVGARERTVANLVLADVCVAPDVGGFSPSDVQPMTEIVEHGEAAAEAALTSIRRVIEVSRRRPEA